MSKAITLTIPHELGRTEARRRIDEGFASFSQHMGAVAGQLSKTWSGDRLDFAFAALGQKITGVIDVEDKEIKLEVVLPNLLAMMAEKVRGRLKKEGQLLLEKK
jgi:putative polyhydroxyalkanoate system protein